MLKAYLEYERIVVYVKKARGEEGVETYLVAGHPWGLKAKRDPFCPVYRYLYFYLSDLGSEKTVTSKHPIRDDER